MEFIDLKTQQKRIRDRVEERIKRVLDHGQYILGPEVQELEEKLAEWVGVKHAIACANGTDALQLTLMALDIKPGDEVITSPFTFIANAEVIALLGAVPVFVDIDPRTYNLDSKYLETAITPRTRAIMPVSLYGQVADLDAIEAVAKKHHLTVIEDAAQSFGATYKGKRSCSISPLSATSFFPSKSLGCYGDGGAVFTTDDRLADRIKKIRSHGQRQRYEHVVLGVNSRLDTFQAAILLEKLAIFDEEVISRKKIGTRYSEKLKDVVQTPYVESYNRSVYAQYTIEADNREELRAHLQKNGIPTAVHYPCPIHLQEAFKYLGYKTGQFPASERAAGRVISLPMHPYLSEADQDKVVLAITTLLQH